MKRTIVVLAMLLLATLAVGQKDTKVTVKVIEREDSNVPYSYMFANGNAAIAQNLNLRGATLTIQFPDGRTAVVNCTSKFQERFAGPGNVRSCRVPLVDELQVETNGDKAKLFWNVSLDGKKVQSETYKIIAVSDAPK
jgi:hypothetical protein